MKNQITPFLTYDGQAEEAAKLYTSIFKNSKITSKMSGPDGKVMSVTFEIGGQEIMTLNGGPTFRHEEGFSLFVSCETQEEIDAYWTALIADGGSEGHCGWCKDKFGVSWQIIPTVLGRLFSDPDRARAGRGIQAMMGMKKLDIAALERAADGS